MKRLLIASLAALAAACSPPAQQSAQSPSAESPAPLAPAQSACHVEAASDWQAGTATYRIAGVADGDACAAAVARLTIQAPSGATIFSAEHVVSAVPLAFSGREDQAALQSELTAWTQNVAQGPDASALPAWPAAAQKPPHFAPATTRDLYEAARAAKRPIFCYPDANESNACVAVDPATEAALPLGSWTPERP